MDEPPPMPQAVQRRYALALAGFHWDPHAGAWSRNKLTLAEELIDHIDEETWRAYVQRWMATKPRRLERSTMRHHMERWRSTRAGSEQYDAPMEIRELNLKAGTFRGYASVFNSEVESWIPTIILPGAFTKTLQEHPPSAVKILWMHNLDDPIGLYQELTETAIGLEVLGKISLTPVTEHYLTLLRDRVVDALSIGFDPIRWTIEERGPHLPPLRKISEVRLWEISLVTFGADPQARILDVNRRQGALTTAERLAQLAAAERTLGALERRGPPMSAERLDALFHEAEAALRRICATPEARPSPTREYAAYVREAAAAGRPILPDGSLPPTSLEEQAYLAPLVAQVRAQQAAATRERLRRLEEMELQDSLRPWRR